MKVDKILLSCDDNGNYLKLWKYVSEMCVKLLGVQPVLFHVCDEEKDFESDEFGLVKKVKKVRNVKSSIQAQWYRIYGTSYFPNENCLISDIDMLIPNKEYFLNQVSIFEENSLVVYSSDVYSENIQFTEKMFRKNRLPICYFLGKGKLFTSILEIESNFSNFLYKVLSYDFGYEVPYGDRDEIYCGHKIIEKEQEFNLIKLKRNVINVWDIPNRVEKKNFFNLKNSEIEKKTIIDFHVPNNFVDKLEEFEDIYFKILETYK
jgi:hypothetical protein